MDGANFVFAHLADAHVGAWSREPAVRRALRESVLRALDVVTEHRCEFLLVSGDLFHTPVPEPGEVAPVAARLRKLVAAGIRVYVIYGSHDYVAHRTSWLDVLAETGLFLRAAPEAIRSEGQRWTLPFLVDEPTGARIAGISGRAQGLDRSYFAAVDSEAFRAAPGFKIFQFHAAVEEYLPPHLREHIHGISREDLPGACDYYAGGHIHYSYEGTGPNGGLLINPGSVFGTSVTDLEYGARGVTNQGLVIVTVRDGRPSTEFVRTASQQSFRVFDVDVTGRTAAEARQVVTAALEAETRPGVLLFPKVHGVLAGGSVGALGLHESASAATAQGAENVHWDVRGLAPADEDPGAQDQPLDELERAAVRELQGRLDPSLEDLLGPGGERRLRDLMQELGTSRGEGESKQDYLQSRVEAALAILRLRSSATEGA
ncbi:MAG: DNA repair exonuclease [Thermoplasmata archaeon]